MLKKVVYLKQQNTRHKQPCLPCQRNTQTWFPKEPFFNIGAKTGTPKNCSQKEQQTAEMKTCQRKKNRKRQNSHKCLKKKHRASLQVSETYQKWLTLIILIIKLFYLVMDHGKSVFFIEISTNILARGSQASRRESPLALELLDIDFIKILKKD